MRSATNHRLATLFVTLALAVGALACGTSPGPLSPADMPDTGVTPGAADAAGEAATPPRSTDGGSNDAATLPEAAADATSGSPDAASPVDAGRAADAKAPSADASSAGEAGATRDAATDAAGLADAGQTGGGDAGLPGVRIVGRTMPGTGGPRFEWSGVSMTANFTGTQISVQLTEQQSTGNEFEIVLDGVVRPNLVTRGGTVTYPLATGLTNASHSIAVWRRTEASYGYTEFLGFSGFSAGAGLLQPPAAPAHQIEIVGDSISCGYGIEGNSTCTTPQLESIENNYMAYGSVAGRLVGADVMTTAWSGIGVYRNYNEVGPSVNTMPQRYDFTIPLDMSTLWDFSKYQPGAVVINLTSNDFSVFGDPGQPYITAFVTFVQHIRTKYPATYFFLVIEWTGNGSDSSTDVNAVVSAIKNGGDARIESFDIRPFANGNGCQGHPDLAGGQAMGTGLAAEIKRVLNW